MDILTKLRNNNNNNNNNNANNNNNYNTNNNNNYNNNNNNNLLLGCSLTKSGLHTCRGPCTVKTSTCGKDEISNTVSLLGRKLYFAVSYAYENSLGYYIILNCLIAAEGEK